MNRGAGGDGNAPAQDEFLAVRDLVEKIGNRQATSEEVESVRPALETLYAKLMRIRSLSPAFRRVDFSEEVWMLMRRIGKKVQPVPGSAIGRAASFL